MYLSIYQSIYPFIIFIYLSIYLSIYPFMYPSINLSFMYLSIHQSIRISLLHITVFLTSSPVTSLSFESYSHQLHCLLVSRFGPKTKLSWWRVVQVDQSRIRTRFVHPQLVDYSSHGELVLSLLITINASSLSSWSSSSPSIHHIHHLHYQHHHYHHHHHHRNPFVMGAELCGPKICFYVMVVILCAVFITLMFVCQPFLNIVINLIFVIYWWRKGW